MPGKTLHAWILLGGSCLDDSTLPLSADSCHFLALKGRKWASKGLMQYLHSLHCRYHFWLCWKLKAQDLARLTLPSCPSRSEQRLAEPNGCGCSGATLPADLQAASSKREVGQIKRSKAFQTVLPKEGNVTKSCCFWGDCAQSSQCFCTFYDNSTTRQRKAPANKNSNMKCNALPKLGQNWHSLRRTSTRKKADRSSLHKETPWKAMACPRGACRMKPCQSSSHSCLSCLSYPHNLWKSRTRRSSDLGRSRWCKVSFCWWRLLRDCAERPHALWPLLRSEDLQGQQSYDLLEARGSDFQSNQRQASRRNAATLSFLVRSRMQTAAVPLLGFGVCWVKRVPSAHPKWCFHWKCNAAPSHAA